MPLKKIANWKQEYQKEAEIGTQPSTTWDILGECCVLTYVFTECWAVILQVVVEFLLLLYPPWFWVAKDWENRITMNYPKGMVESDAENGDLMVISWWSDGDFMVI